jgi:hypothetical protein
LQGITGKKKDVALYENGMFGGAELFHFWNTQQDFTLCKALSR